MNNNQQFDYNTLSQESERNRIIREENKKTYALQQKSKYTSEQQEKAEDDAAGQEIRQHYDNVLWPSINDVVYYLSYIASLAYLFLIRIFPEKELSIIAYVLLLAIAVVISIMEKVDHKKNLGTMQGLRFFNNFVNHTSIYGYILTAIGFMSVKSDTLLFWIIYSLLLVVFIVRTFSDILNPAITKIINHRKHG